MDANSNNQNNNTGSLPPINPKLWDLIMRHDNRSAFQILSDLAQTIEWLCEETEFDKLFIAMALDDSLEKLREINNWPIVEKVTSDPINLKLVPIVDNETTRSQIDYLCDFSDSLSNDVYSIKGIKDEQIRDVNSYFSNVFDLADKIDQIKEWAEMMRTTVDGSEATPTKQTETQKPNKQKPKNQPRARRRQRFELTKGNSEQEKKSKLYSFHKSLKDGCLIDSQTEYDAFYYAFGVGENEQKQIIWTGGYNELYWLIKTLFEKQCVSNCDKWAVTKDNFKIRNKEGEITDIDTTILKNSKKISDNKKLTINRAVATLVNQTTYNS